MDLQGLTKEGEKTSYILSDCLKDEESHRSVHYNMSEDGTANQVRLNV